MNAQTAKLLGCEKHDLFDEDTEQVLDDIMEGGLNARQCIEKIKGPFGAGVMPCFPDDVPGDMPEHPNVYTDGGVLYPKHTWAAIAGFGVWWPGRLDAEEDVDGAVDLVHSFQRADGFGQWNALPGQRCSSTRVEVAAVTIAFLKKQDASHWHGQFGHSHEGHQVV